MSEQWVVTYQAETSHCISTTEFFRGEKDECLRIKQAFGGCGEDDRHRTKRGCPWGIIVGPADNWDEFLRDVSGD